MILAGKFKILNFLKKELQGDDFMADKTIYVYDSFSNNGESLLGILYVNNVRGNETFSFDFDFDWLKNNKCSSTIDPELSFVLGRQFSKQRMFGMFEDACPDRWGRTLLQKRENLNAKKEGRKPNKLLESDYLLGVDDYTRMGGLRFKLDKDGPFVSNDKENSIPPWTSLRTLEEAARNFEKDSPNIDKWVEQLIKPGSSLGGARPKASVVDTHGNLWIGKFLSKHDEYDVCAFEKVANDLAFMCGLNVPETKLEKFSKYGSTFLVERFDRDNDRRIQFASAMTLLNKTDNEDVSSYLDLAYFIKENGSNPKDDLLELYKRIAFNIAISNTDDHLRNHAFIYGENGFRLSPLYDINPTPYNNQLSLNIDEISNDKDFELLLSTCKYYGLDKNKGRQLIVDIVDVVSENYETLARSYGINRSQIEDMKIAFASKKELFI